MADEYELRILRALRKIIRAVDSYSRKLVMAHGITSPQLICLSEIVESEPTTLSELSRRVYLSPSTVNGILDRLERSGLICRKRTDQDRRKVAVTSTKQGRKIVKQTPSLLQDKLAEELKLISAEKQHDITCALEQI